MEDLFSSLALQTVQLVGKAAFGAASSLAVRRVTQYVNHQAALLTADNKEEERELESLLSQFATKLRIVTPAIDLIEIIAARGHSTVTGALPLTQQLRRQVEHISRQISSAKQPDDKSASTTTLNSVGGNSVVGQLRQLLDDIDGAVPLLTLALATSSTHPGTNDGESSLFANNMTSPSRLLQASSALLSQEQKEEGPVGGCLRLRLYSLFVGSVRPKSQQDFTWKEDFALTQCVLWKLPPVTAKDTDTVLAEYGYELRLVEDLRDGRYHQQEEESLKLDPWVKELCPTENAGRALRIPLQGIRSMHYTSAGSLLNIEDSNSAVLVLGVRRQQTTGPPVAGDESNLPGKKEEFGKADKPSVEDTVWYALETAPPEQDEESDSEEEEEEKKEDLAETFDNKCTMNGSTVNASQEDAGDSDRDRDRDSSALSQLEYMVRLASVEVCEQTSHLLVPDEKLRLYMMARPPASRKSP